MLLRLRVYAILPYTYEVRNRELRHRCISRRSDTKGDSSRDFVCFSGADLPNRTH
jgi:hypothetical protein